MNKNRLYCQFSTTVQYCDSSCFEESQHQHAKRGSAKKQIWPDFYFTWSIEHIIVTTVQARTETTSKKNPPTTFLYCNILLVVAKQSVNVIVFVARLVAKTNVTSDLL